MGYSIDNISLLGLTLSVGLVVDDAIVMLENIVRHVEAGMSPFEAALTGSREVVGTIVSMSISLVAVFLPILLMGGIVGRVAERIRHRRDHGHPVLRRRVADRHADAGGAAAAGPGPWRHPRRPVRESDPGLWAAASAGA